MKKHSHTRDECTVQLRWQGRMEPAATLMAVLLFIESYMDTLQWQHIKAQHSTQKRPVRACDISEPVTLMRTPLMLLSIGLT